jgi:hypothetical protein
MFVTDPHPSRFFFPKDLMIITAGKARQPPTIYKQLAPSRRYCGDTRSLISVEFEFQEVYGQNKADK